MTPSNPRFTDREHSVFKVFRDYLMTPGKMLCFSGPNLEMLNLPLRQLTAKGLLIKERNRSAYSLTDQGFIAMRNNA